MIERNSKEKDMVWLGGFSRKENELPKYKPIDKYFISQIE